MSKLVPISPKEYRKRHPQTKLFEAPSGAVFRIKQIDLFVANELQMVFTKMPAGKITAQNVYEFLPELARILLPNGVEEPKIALEPSDDTLSIDELQIGDKIALILEIIDFSGIGEAGQRLARSFRRRAARKTRS